MDADIMNQEDFEEYIEHLNGGSFINADKIPSLLAPTAYGKTFMMNYGIQVSLKHPGIFSQPT